MSNQADFFAGFNFQIELLEQCTIGTVVFKCHVIEYDFATANCRYFRLIRVLNFRLQLQNLNHVGGIAKLLEYWKVPVYGPRGEPIDTLTQPVAGGDRVWIPELGVDFEVLDIPGHTRAHIAYYGGGMLFCGDTLFACGCGRAFEGPPEQLYRSLQKLTALPDETLVYCGHEYTVANIDFALAVEPGNAALFDRSDEERSLRAANRPTLPSTIGREKATNPFLRCTQPAVIESADKYLGSRVSEPAQVFAALRNWKNSF